MVFPGSIVCGSAGACEDANIEGFKNLKAWGDNAIRGVNLDSGTNINDPFVNIEINGSSTNFINITCNNDMICTINCQSKDACRLVRLQCNSNATCITICDEDAEYSYACPLIISNSSVTYSNGDSGYCHKASSCALIDTSVPDSDINMECYGLDSCRSDIYVRDYSGYNSTTGVECWGSYSCYATDTIYLQGFLHCGGLLRFDSLKKQKI